MNDEYTHTQSPHKLINNPPPQEKAIKTFKVVEESLQLR